MANSVYESAIIETVDGERIYITPLKIKYLRLFMDTFEDARNAQTQDQFLDTLLDCTAVAMMQFKPEIKNREDVADAFDIKTVYKIVDVAAGIKLNQEKEKMEDAEVSVVKTGGNGQTWDEMDLVKLESEVFLLGIWKDYEDLESSLSMSELAVTLGAKREEEYASKKFMAALQGVDIDKGSEERADNAFERMKTRIMTDGATDDPNDILALQGENAKKAGFGIGEGLSYEKWD
jgi:hypothetical protein